MATGESFLSDRVTLYSGDCLAVLAELAESSLDSCVTDPPYNLESIVKRFGTTTPDREQFAMNNPTEAYGRVSRGFMGKEWDTDIAFRPATWHSVLRVLKPGAWLIAMGGTRTYHRLACAIEDAGFVVYDMMAWTYGSGFPKSHSVAKVIDRANGVAPTVVGTTRRYDMRGDAWGSNNPKLGERERYFDFVETVPTSEEAQAWAGWGTALKPALEPCCLARKPLSEKTIAGNVRKWGTGGLNIDACRVGDYEPLGGLGTQNGRWPANIVHDGSADVLAAMPEADRFYYTAKADQDDRLGSKHPTVKPVDLLQYFVRLITPKGGTCLDPFAGSGTLGEAAYRENMSAVLIEKEAEYQADIRRRMSLILAGPEERARESIKAKNLPRDEGPLFAYAGQRELPLFGLPDRLPGCARWPGCGCGTQSGPHTCEGASDGDGGRLRVANADPEPS